MIFSSKNSLLLLAIPIVKAKTNIPDRLTIEQLKPSVDELVSSMEENLPNAIQSDLRILLCFMCGGESNEIEQFFAQLSSRFTLIANQYAGNSSFIIKTFLQRSTRKVISEKSKENFLLSNFSRSNSFLFHFIRYLL